MVGVGKLSTQSLIIYSSEIMSIKLVPNITILEMSFLERFAELSLTK